MSASLTGSSDETRAGLRRVSLIRVLFYLTAFYGCYLLWIPPRLPLSDLPQHAAQIGLLHDLLTHASPWTHLVRLNYFTPYLTGYSLGVLLSFLMPVSSALKFVLTVAYLAFVYGCVALRKRFSDDDRLDWLFIPSFFGFAFIWGFYTFLISAPIGLMFMLIAHRYALRPGIGPALAVMFAGIVLFFSHGLVFVFSCAVGAGFLFVEQLIKQRALRAFLLATTPYCVFGVLCVVYAVITHDRDPLISLHDYLPGFGWDISHRGLFLLYVWGMRKQDALFLLGGALMFAAPFLLGLRLNRANPSAMVPLVVVIGVWIFMPSYALKIPLLYERFALFLMPAYAMAFCKRPDRTGPERRASMHVPGFARNSAVLSLLALSCWGFMAVQTVRLHRFIAESAPFETILDLMEPGQRAVNLIFDRDSEAYSAITYLQYGSWYQAEKHGFVDYNFAWYLPQPARFRLDQLPAITPGYDWRPDLFDWKTSQGRLYRYFILRDVHDQGKRVLTNDECEVRLVRRVGVWSLYERGACR